MVKLWPLVQHWLDEDVELVGIAVLGPVDPLVVAVAVHQAGEEHLLRLVDGRQARAVGRFSPTDGRSW